MKVVIKRPSEGMKVIEVASLIEINKLVGNLDEKGNGCSYTGGDFRESVFSGIDMHLNGSAIFNAELEENFWDLSGNNLYCGTVIFTGYDQESGDPYGVCSLKDEQIEFLMNNISSIFAI